MTDFDEAAAFTLHGEEKQQTAPLAGDPGGATNWGVTLARLSEWRGYRCTPAEVYAMPYDEAEAIFRTGYWHALRCDDLPRGVDLMVADHSFNAGTGTSAKLLQRLVGVDADGIIGPLTIRATTEAALTGGLLAGLRDAQRADYQTKADFPQFGAEWIGRPDAADEWRRLGRLGRRYAAAMRLAAMPSGLNGS